MFFLIGSRRGSLGAVVIAAVGSGSARAQRGRTRLGAQDADTMAVMARRALRRGNRR
jgi:hypothetical protein